MNRFVVSLALCSMLVFAPVSHAASRCPASSTGCTLDNASERIKERVQEGKDKVRETNNPAKKGAEAGKTIIDCARCGMDAVRNNK
ncbi:MAG: hypothetical protein JWQ11_2749 [Rhizobacter sp.]|nr:hypothetical protein [Rhizobacter sp.]